MDDATQNVHTNKDRNLISIPVVLFLVWCLRRCVAMCYKKSLPRIGGIDFRYVVENQLLGSFTGVLIASAVIF